MKNCIHKQILVKKRKQEFNKISQHISKFEEYKYFVTQIEKDYYAKVQNNGEKLRLLKK